MTHDSESVPTLTTIDTAGSEPAERPTYEPPVLVAHGRWQMLTTAISLEIGPGGD
ncbi:hypothetical protein [Deinococcus cellulosilyticus]|uniref:Uncharacterized protein n=1 Tax=Deinococcus cellulosilyticus (strain DSM 18568 / NBRC 106333 / KACC 11606 / 5516J-15) TaxID=1223518 RepID=A0A511N685_DEIC1|nr:hypothetical protein [Deinococcus cellulosilyticus]GEM48355.1 hypothetical protein DC3_39900 [Deinococcus cellulosilyticus NBRC 106333 = KACC 11606]